MKKPLADKDYGDALCPLCNGQVLFKVEVDVEKSHGTWDGTEWIVEIDITQVYVVSARCEACGEKLDPKGGPSGLC